MAYGPPRKDHDRHIDIIGFAPDADLDIPGACSVLDGAVPTLRGWRAAPSFDATPRFANSLALDSTLGGINYFPSLSLMVLSTKDDRFYSGMVGFTMREVTGTLTGSGVGDLISHPMTSLGGYIGVGFVSAGTSAGMAAAVVAGTFAGIPNSPAALHLVTANRFVMALSTEVNSAAWRCCARDDLNSWTQSPVTLATQGILADDNTLGIRSATAFGDDVIAFKTDRAYIGSFVPNDAEVWKWRLLPIHKGAIRGRTSTPYRQGILFLSNDNLYYFDGANLEGLMDARMSRWFSERCVPNQGQCSVVVDQIRDLVFVNVLVYDSDLLATYVHELFVCHPPTKRWSRWNSTNIYTIGKGPPMYGGAAVVGTTRHELASVWAAPSDAKLAIPKEIAAPTTVGAIAQIVTNDFGDYAIDSELTRAHLKFTRAPTGASPTATAMRRNALDATLSTASSVTRAADGMFDVRQNARWHRLKFDLYGDWEIAGYAVDLDSRGKR